MGPTPSWRQPGERPISTSPAFSAAATHALVTGLDQDGLGRDARHPLNHQSGAREEPARVALPLLRLGCRACELQRDPSRARHPGAELDGGPLVLGATERNEDRQLGIGAPGSRHEDADIARHAGQGRGERLRETSVVEQTARRVDEQELALLLGDEQRQIVIPVVRRERSGAHRHVASRKRSASCLELPGGVREQPSAPSTRSARISSRAGSHDEWIGKLEQPVDCIDR